MLRSFLILAVVNGSLLLASFVLELLATSDIPGPGTVRTGAQVPIALLMTMTTCAVHSTAYAYLLTSGRRAGMLARLHDLPEWINEQTSKNKKKAFPFAAGGMILMAGVAGIVWASGPRVWESSWFLFGSAVALAFNIAASVAEYATVAAQGRILLEVRARAGQSRVVESLAGVVQPSDSTKEGI